MKLTLLLACVAALSLPVIGHADDAAKPATEDHKAESHKDHKHGKKCGHKAEKHGDHTDYEHEEDGKTHHHKKHGNHFDECEGPEAGAAAKTDAHSTDGAKTK